MIINPELGEDRSAPRSKLKPGTTKRALKFAASYRWPLGLVLLLVLVDAAVGIANPLVYRDIINNGILKQDYARVVHSATLVAGLGLLSGILGLAQTYLGARIGAHMVFSLRTRVFEHVQQMPLAFFARTQTGALVSRLNNDVNGAGVAFTDILSNAVGNLVMVVFLVGAMFMLSWRITLAALVLPPLLVLPVRLWGRQLQALARESYDLMASMNSFMVERFNVAGAQLAKLFGHPGNESKAFEANAACVSGISVKTAVYARLLFSSLFLITSFATALSYGWGGVLALNHILDVGTVVALASYLSRLYVPLVEISNIQVSLMTTLVSFERIFEILDLQPMIKEAPRASLIPLGPARIEFDHVCFRYPCASEVSLGSLESIGVPDISTEKVVLTDITFSVEPGQLVALVGPSGAGKTTITQLVTRMYDVQSGSIKINGIDVRNAKLNSLHQRIGVVTQDPHFFHDSIRANLLYAKPNAADPEIMEALHAARMLHVITSLPNGLDTVVGERGYRFSGGEKQRLAIARLVLKAPDIFILDEATAHLDSESEAAIQEALERARSGRTCIVIAHRLSTIQKADEILVVENGGLVQRGTHAQLLDSLGVYAALYHRQFAHHELSTSVAVSKTSL